MEARLVETIVPLLKSNLEINLTLLQFSEMPKKELLDLLNLVVHNVSEDQPEKIGMEKIEDTIDRISEFLRVLKFSFPCPPEEWDRRMSVSDVSAIYPALLFLLRDMSELKSKAYRAKFMEPVYVPEEIAVDTSVETLQTQLRELQEQFLTLSEQVQSFQGLNTEEMRKIKKNLESDKAMLVNKISMFKRKLEKEPNMEPLLQITKLLRIENEREIKLQDQHDRLKEEHSSLQRSMQVSSERIRGFQAHLEKSIEAKRAELAALKSSAIEETTEKNLMFMQKQVISASKLIMQKEQKLNEIKQKRAEMENSLVEKQSIGIVQMPTESEFKNYVQMLKTKKENFREMQNEIANQKRELAVVLRTKALVEQQKEKIHQDISNLEREQGIHGFREARVKLEQISAAKADLDDMKGKTLEEMSSIVQNIQLAIQARQNELKPYVNSLQEVRKKKQLIENDYLKSKQKYQNAEAEYDTMCIQLTNEINSFKSEVFKYQSKYFHIQSLFNSLNRSIKRAADEKKAIESGNPISNSLKSYSDMFQKESLNMKKQISELKKAKKAQGNENASSQKQIEIFQGLRRLLQIKQQCQKIAQEDRKKKKKQQEMEADNKEQLIVLDQNI